MMSPRTSPNRFRERLTTPSWPPPWATGDSDDESELRLTMIFSNYSKWGRTFITFQSNEGDCHQHNGGIIINKKTGHFKATELQGRFKVQVIQMAQTVEQGECLVTMFATLM